VGFHRDPGMPGWDSLRILWIKGDLLKMRIRVNGEECCLLSSPVLLLAGAGTE
jgi:hypothetical protein